MADIAGEAVWVIKGDKSELEQDLAAATGSVKKTTDQVAADFATVGKGMTLVGAAIAAPLALGVKSAMEFGSAMAGVASLGVKDIGTLEAAVREAAVAYGQDLVGATQATYQAISAGVSEMDAPLVLAEAAKAATAGQTDLTTAIELGTAMTSAFGGEMTDMGRVFDSAFTAVKLGVTTFEELSASAGKTAPAFAAAGLSVDDMYGSVAALTKGGLGTAESFTAMTAVMSSFTRQGELSKFETLGLQGALDWLSESTGGSQTKMLEFLGSTEALGAVLSLTGAVAGDFTAIMDAMSEKAGATQEAFNIIAETDPAFAWNQLKAAMQDLSITVGQALLPALKALMDMVAPALVTVANFAKEHEKLTATVVLAAGAFAAFMVTVGPLLMILPGLIAAVKAVVVVFGIIAGVMSGPVILAVAAVVAAFVGAGAALYYFWDEAKALFSSGVDAIASVAGGLFSLISDAWSAGAGVVGALLTAWWDSQKYVWDLHVGSIIGVASALWEGVAQVWQWGGDIVSKIWGGIVAAVQTGVSVMIESIKLLAAPFVWIMDQIRNVLDAIGATAPQMPANTPGFAEGGQLQEGLNVVGERGREALYKSGNDVRVLSAANTAAAGIGAGGGNVSINISGVTIGSDYDVSRLAQRLGQEMRQRMTGIGYAAAGSRI